MCLLKCIILLEKQHFRIFQDSNIRNETRLINKNHFLSYTTWISVSLSKVSESPHLLFRTVSPQMFHLKNNIYVGSRAIPPEENCPPTLFLTLTRNSKTLFCLKNNIFEFFSTQIFAMKVDESIKTIFI